MRNVRTPKEVLEGKGRQREVAIDAAVDQINAELDVRYKKGEDILLETVIQDNILNDVVERIEQGNWKVLSRVGGRLRLQADE